MKTTLRAIGSALAKSKKFRKAYTAAGLTFTTLLGQALLAGTLTRGVALAALGAALLAGAAIYRIPNSEA